MNEVCDEKKFYKTLSGPLVEARAGLLDGLFTVRGFLAGKFDSELMAAAKAFHEEHNWGVARECYIVPFIISYN